MAEKGMLDGLFGALGIGADIDYEDKKEPDKTDPPKEEKKEEKEMEEQRDHSTMGNLPKSMDPHKMYGSKFDDWVKENRPDAYKE